MLQVVAEDNAFDSECYATASNKAFRIELTNRDTFDHNFSIYKTKGGERLFQGPYVQGTKTQTMDVGPQPPQRAYFVCDIHPQMEGAFIFA